MKTQNSNPNSNVINPNKQADSTHATGTLAEPMSINGFRMDDIVATCGSLFLHKKAALPGLRDNLNKTAGI